MNELTIKRLAQGEELPWDLLLLADPSKELIVEYLAQSDVYIALINCETIGVYVLTKNSSEVAELKNIAVDEKHQGN
jgi:hypothetical protein